MDSPSSSARRVRSRSKSVGRAVSVAIHQLNNRDYLIGIGLLLVVVFLWTTSNFVTQDLFQDGYEKAFLVTYLNTSSFALYLLPSAVGLCFRRDGRGVGITAHDEYEPLATDETLLPESPEPQNVRKYARPRSSEQTPLTLRETVDLAFAFCFVWFAANWALNAALDYTSVASATILSSTSGFFTLGIGRIFRVESLTLAKIGAVLTSFGGVVLVSLSDTTQTGSALDDHATNPILGDILALLSAAFYALYVILLKVRIGSESRIDMKLFFGFVGIFSIISCWPIGVVLHFTGIEKFELPSTGKAVAALIVNMAITWSSDFLYVLAMLKTTPLVVTIGLSLTIPLAVIGDFFLSKPAEIQVIVGAVLVLFSFVVVGIDDASSHLENEPLVIVDEPVERGRADVDISLERG